MTSNEKKSPKRDYEMKERARKVEETRQRITEAAVELHGSVGPAQTTVTEVARLAGVRRATVYNHFPSDEELLEACSSHWLQGHPPPDATRWAQVEDPDARLGTALEELYRWYAGGREMMSNSLRDASLVPALAKALEKRWWPYMDQVVDILAEGRSDPHPHLGPILRLAVSFHSWETLRGAGLDDAEAAEVAAGLVPD